MDEARSVRTELQDLTARATEVAAEVANNAESLAQPQGSLEDTLSDAMTNVRRAIVEQPITSVMLVGAFAFLWGLNRRT